MYIVNRSILAFDEIFSDNGTQNDYSPFIYESIV